MKDSKQVRISIAAHKILRNYSFKENKHMGKVLEELILKYLPNYELTEKANK